MDASSDTVYDQKEGFVWREVTLYDQLGGFVRREIIGSFTCPSKFHRPDWVVVGR